MPENLSNSFGEKKIISTWLKYDRYTIVWLSNDWSILVRINSKWKLFY